MLVDARHNFGDARLDVSVLAEVSDISDILVLFGDASGQWKALMGRKYAYLCVEKP